MNQPTISISATFTAEPVSLPLSSWLRELNLPHRVEFTPYGHVLQSLVDPHSVFVRDSGGLNVLLIRLEDLAHVPDRLPDRGTELCDAVKLFANRSSSPTLICFCPDAPDASDSMKRLSNEVQQQITQNLREVTGVYVVSSKALMETYPVTGYFDDILSRTAHIPYSRAFFAALGTMIARRLFVLQRKPSKVIVLDCDNTLWQGACGELGPQGVTVEEVHQDLQRHMIRLREQGMLLALCSKNKEQDVWDVFEQNSEMLLRREHITASEINWNAKSENLRRIAGKLGLGIETLILLDDHPVEIGEVQAHCPEAIAIRLPAPAEIPRFLQHIWVFDRLQLTSDDHQRAESYRIEAHRQERRQDFDSLRKFLEDLELQVRFLDVNEENLERVSQLTQRTNQFNFNLTRRTGSEIRDVLSKPNTHAIAVDVKDKFGEYGLVGFMIYQRQERSLHVDTFLLSCRALGRGVERHMLCHLGKLASESGFSEVSIQFVQGERNEPASVFLENVGESSATQSDESVEYRFPSTLLQGIDPLEVNAAATARDTGESIRRPSPADSVQPDSEMPGRIASRYQTVEQILVRISKEAEPRRDLEEPFVSPNTDLERQIADICREVLHVDMVGTNDSLHDLGGASLQIVQIHSQLVQKLGADITISELYTLPSIRAIAQRMQTVDDARSKNDVASRVADHHSSGQGIAVIGMAGRFPGADNVEQFWDNLINAVNSIVEIPESELNLSPDSPLRTHPNLVRKSAAVIDADKFDARFFGIFPKEAQVMDPQHRLMLEVCWHALEDAGYCPDSVERSVGVFAGCYMDTYILASLASNPQLLESLANSFHGGDLLTELGNDKDYLATRISFLLNLKGPSLTVQTACSTSLVAIVQACQALETGQCEMALAGGSTLKFPQNRGYLYADGGMVSPDGVCRTFDADARGTVFGEGVGAVLLKRVEDAIADGDDIYGVIKGWGLNNDGRSKMGYTAPSVDGQSAVIRMAHQRAGISADTITYVEAHGTGTSLGDPIEVDALTKAFRATTERKQFCAIGSVKSNIGHLDVAAGVTGLIKNCLAMYHGVIPPSLNFNRANPNIDFENSPFYVVTEKQEWKRGTTPRRAGLSSFGVGGTNAHVVVEESPLLESSDSSRNHHLLILSARSQDALDQMTDDLALRLEEEPNLNLADVAYTLQVGRKTFNYSRALVAQDVKSARELLSSPDQESVSTHHQVRREVPVAFMFPGQGSQHVNMARGLYQTDAIFKAHFDECCELLLPHVGFDLKEKLFLPESDAAAAELNQTTIAQPAIFTVSYALAKSLEHLGIIPDRMIGHSVGEFVAACLAGVYSLADALRLIAFRGRSMQQLPSGSMMAVRLTETELSSMLDKDVVIAAINGPTLCVVAGPTESIDKLEQDLESKDIICRRLHTSHAFHSAMMDPVIEPFAELLKDVPLSEPAIPIISSVTGEILSKDRATDPMYSARHLRETVRFTDALEQSFSESECTLLEVGPGRTLSTLARQHPSCPKQSVVLSSLPHAKLAGSTTSHFLLTVGRLWQAGANVNWSAYYQGERRSRLHLPTYPFERQRYWFEETTTETENTIKQSSRVRESVDDPQSPPTVTQHSQGDAVDVTGWVIQQQLQIMRQQLEAWKT